VMAALPEVVKRFAGIETPIEVAAIVVGVSCWFPPTGPFQLTTVFDVGKLEPEMVMASTP
jgi:hypothetical protein